MQSIKKPMTRLRAVNPCSPSLLSEPGAAVQHGPDNRRNNQNDAHRNRIFNKLINSGVVLLDMH